MSSYFAQLKHTVFVQYDENNLDQNILTTERMKQMKVKNLVGQRFKERPADCVIDSHALMVRGGYMKNVGNGIFSEYPVLHRITAKIENIIREEMNAIDGQEVLFPVVMPADLWQESGRYDSNASGRENL